MAPIATHFEIVLVTLFALTAAVVVLQQRRTPQSAAAWLLFIGLVPYIAIPLFLAVGFRKGRSRFQHIAFSSISKSQRAVHPTELDTVLQKFEVPDASEGNRLDLLDSPQSSFAGLMELIATARESIDVVFYIVADDPVGEAFVDALAEKARAGVKVRLLIDWLGSFRRPRRALSRLESAGGELRYFLPLLHRPVRSNLNLRNHRKFVLADKARVFSGGTNVGAEYMGPAPATDQWTDLAYLLEGPAVPSFRDVFESDWVAAGGTASDRPLAETTDRPGVTTAQLVACGPDMRFDPLHDGLVHSIHAAKRRVWIVTPYFLPTELLNNALTIAARRGVDVRILLPQRSNHHVADFARGAYLREMQDGGCKVLLFQSGMIHAKAGIIDDTAYVGSANFDVRSMLLNFETVLFIHDADTVLELTDWYARQEVQCRPGLASCGVGRRIMEGMFRLGAPIL